jgi:hypothetical protein
MATIQVACVSHIASVGYLPSHGGGNSATEQWQTPRHYPPLHWVISASHNKKKKRAFFLKKGCILVVEISM